MLLRILVALNDEGYAENFMMSLLPRGYEVYIVEGHDVLMKIVHEHAPHVIIYDTDARVFGGIEGLRTLRQQQVVRSSHIIAFSKESGLDFVRQTMKIGVSGYIYKPIALEGLKEQLYSMLGEVEQRTANRREFVRVKPYPMEKASLELDIPGGESLSGDILDISLGGVAFRLVRPERIGAIVKGHVYNSMRLSLDELGAVTISAIAVLARGDTAAFQFKNMDEESLKILCRYIHNKLVRDRPDSPHDKYMQMV